MPVAFTSFLNASQMFALVTAPISDSISVSSSSSKKSSSIFVNEFITPVILLARASFVFFKPLFSFSKNPIEKFLLLYIFNQLFQSLIGFNRIIGDKRFNAFVYVHTVEFLV